MMNWEQIEAPTPRALMSIGPGRLIAGLATGGQSEVARYVGNKIKNGAKGAYGKVYGGPAQEQKDAADKGISDLDQLAGGVRNDIHTTGVTARGRYGPVDSAINNYSNNAPTNIRDRLGERQGNRPTSVQSQLLGKVYSTPLTDLYNSGTIGKTPTAVESRYQSRAAAPVQADGNLSTFVNGLKPVGTELRGRVRDREGAQDSLSTYMAGRLSAPKDRIATEDMMDSIGKESGDLSRAAVGHVDNYNEAARMKAYDDAYNPTDPGMMESFAQRELSDGSEGQRVFDRMADQTQKRIQRASAARGGFVSGASMRQEGEALADLSGQRYAQLADLANKGQSANLARIAQGFGMEKDIDAQGLEKLGMGLQARKFGIDAATSADSTRVGAASATDQTRTGRQGMLDRLAGETSAAEAARAKALDDLANGITSADHNRDVLGADVAGKRDTIGQNERRDIDTLAGKAGDSALTREGHVITTATGASGETDQQRTGDRALAKGTDEFNQHIDDQIDSLAKGASEETRTTLKDTVSMYKDLADSLSGIDTDEGKQQASVQMQTALEKIQLMLTKSGVDAATIQAFVNNVTTLASDGVKAYTGGK